jgi:hypothetical protein
MTQMTPMTPMTPTPDGAALARLLETTEAAAYADLLQAAPADWRAGVADTAAGCLLVAPALDLLLFNRLIACGVRTVATAGAVHEAVARLRAAGVRNFGVQLCPAAQPAAVRDWLTAEGLKTRDRWAKVYRDAAPAAAVRTSLRVARAAPAQAPLVAEVTTAGFGMPPVLQPWIASMVGRAGWQHYLAWDGSDPVAAAALFVRDGAGWLGMASTLPAARRRGAQGALMAQRIEDGRTLGCQWLVTETAEDTPERPNPSYRNMLRAGFTLAYLRDNVMPPV